MGHIVGLLATDVLKVQTKRGNDVERPKKARLRRIIERKFLC